MKVAANLGFLWPELELPERIRAAGRAGFRAVECHYPYAHPPELIAAALAEADTVMLGLNTATGGPGLFGLAALVDRIVDARAAIDQAIEYGAAINAGHVSVLGGVTGGADAAEATYRENLRYAADRAGERGLGIVIEPISHAAVPGVHLSTIDHAASTIEAVGRENVAIMLDVFHTELTEGPARDRIAESLPLLGHIQFASVPDRSEPDHGDVDFADLFRAVVEMGYTGWFGAEYRPRTTTDEGLGWLTELRQAMNQD